MLFTFRQAAVFTGAVRADRTNKRLPTPGVETARAQEPVSSDSGATAAARRPSRVLVANWPQQTDALEQRIARASMAAPLVSRLLAESFGQLAPHS